MATRTVLGALVLTLPQLRRLMNYATVAVFLLFSLSPSLSTLIFVFSGRRQRAHHSLFAACVTCAVEDGCTGCSCVVATIGGIF